MEQHRNWRKRAGGILLWAITLVVALGIGLAGGTKFVQPDRWQRLFTGWGYPPWCSTVVGIAEVAGAIGVLIPRLAIYAAMLLALVMLGAVVTLLGHPGGPLGSGATPGFYLALLAVLVVARRRQRLGARADEPASRAGH